jgi:predicted metal-binding membrane protein
MNYIAELKRQWNAAASRNTISVNYTFYVSAAVIFLASVAATVYFCNSARESVGMACGQLISPVRSKMSINRVESALLFLAMWGVMMVAMMLPSLMPTLIDYRRRSGALQVTRLNQLTCWVSLGYFAVWIAVGVLVYFFGTLLADVATRFESVRRSISVTNGLIVSVAGFIQVSSYKMNHLRRCRHRVPSNRALSSAAWDATEHGIGLGITCFLTCFNLMAVLLAAGVMNLKAMVAVTAAIGIERIRSTPVFAVQLTGAAIIAIGMFMIVHATMHEPIAGYYP